jgi:hypothetical protein
MHRFGVTSLLDLVRAASLTAMLLDLLGPKAEGLYRISWFIVVIGVPTFQGHSLGFGSFGQLGRLTPSHHFYHSTTLPPPWVQTPHCHKVT